MSNFVIRYFFSGAAFILLILFEFFALSYSDRLVWYAVIASNVAFILSVTLPVRGKIVAFVMVVSILLGALLASLNFFRGFLFSFKGPPGPDYTMLIYGLGIIIVSAILQVLITATLASKSR
jgi:hypothetical protein